MHYVVGFALDKDMKRVALIRKKRPKWQDGLLNGIGGKVEADDVQSVYAMMREFWEETGAMTSESNWRQFLSMSTADGHRIDFFYNRYDVDLDKDVSSTTDESVVVVSVTDLQTLETVPNVKWLVPMVLTIAQGDERVKSFQLIERW